MEGQMGNPTRSQIVGLSALLLVITGIVLLSVIRGTLSASSPGIALRETSPANPGMTPQVHTPDSGPPASAPSAVASSAPAPAQTDIVVHVAGAVRNPGLYHLSAGARNADALRAAGGFTRSADPDAVNLAAHVQDGMKLFFPRRDASASKSASAETETEQASIARTLRAEANPRNAPAQDVQGHGDKPGHAVEKLKDPSQGQVDINTANAEQLQRLPGIGSAMAQRLIDFRKQNGGFHTIEDLRQVSGIGDKKFAKLKPFVCVH
jgi:competence protein ComEA